MKKTFILIFVFSLFFSPRLILAQTVPQGQSFNIESSYDLYQRSELTASLARTSLTAYWYIDTKFLDGLTKEEKAQVDESLANLNGEFEINIYPKLTRIFGTEWTPGIDKDTKITILLHPMLNGHGGYGNTADEYPKVQIPLSNEREMIYLNTQYLNTSYAKSFLAHELVHLITFNQKNKEFGLSEDVWLNEARAEYAPTFLGYDDVYEGSNLQRRVMDFLDKPSDSLTEWRETPADYGVVNMFTQYLVDHYGVQILAESMQKRQVGIESINTVLSQLGFQDNFAKIFTNWTIAVLVNNCQISEKYCYFNQNLKNFRMIPLMNYLPFVGESTLSVTNTTKDWAGNWYKFIGGQGKLKIEFAGSSGVFRVPYVINKADGESIIDFMTLVLNQNGEIALDDFGSENLALTIIPIAENKIADFSSLEPSRTFSWTASTQQEQEIVLPVLTPLTKPIFQMTRQEILSRIAEIQAVIIKLQEIMVQLGGVSCSQLTENLYFGIKASSQVMCLQEFLKDQGSAIYPEGIVNGNFFSATQSAVMRFQEKYGIENTGFVGVLTREKINSLLSK